MSAKLTVSLGALYPVPPSTLRGTIMALSAAPVVPATNLRRVILSCFISCSPIVSVNVLVHCLGLLPQRVLDILKALSHFGNSIFAAVFVFDIRGYVPLLLFQQLEDLLDRRVALSPWHVGAVVLLAVLQMEIGDPAMMLGDIGDRIKSGGEEVADVEIDREVLRHRHRLGEAFRLSEFI